MENRLPEILPFDGSFLGEFSFGQVILWSWPCQNDTSSNKSPTLYAILGPNKYPVVLKRNMSKRTDQAVIDEIKPLFGLQKMGSHRISLYGVPKKYNEEWPWLIPNGINTYIYPQWSDYFVFRATGKEVQGQVLIIPVLSLHETIWAPPDIKDFTQEHWNFYYEVQKGFVFRNLCRVSSKSLKDFLVKRDPVRVVSINETKARDPRSAYKQPSDQILKFFFPRLNLQTEVLIQMLGLTKEDYSSKLEMLKNGMSRIVTRVDSEKLWLVDSIITQINDMLSIHCNWA